tara:strand:- start:526 stop:1533 length:1008 start_codon:yes stop_codon:yes gene_type:complete
MKTGGAENQIYNIYQSLEELYDVNLVLLKSSKIENKNFIELNSSKSIFSFFKYIKTVNQLKPDLVISTLPVPNFINAISSLFIKHEIKTFCRVAGYYIDSLSYKLIFYFVSKFADACVFNSESNLHLFKEKFPKSSFKFFYLSNILNFENIQTKINNEIKEEWLDNDEYITGVCVSRLEDLKGIDILIDSMNLIDNERIKMIIIGEGSQFETYKKKLSKNTKLLGFKDNPYPYIYKADFYCQPSRREGMANSLMEAMSLNKYSIVSNCYGGNKDLVSKYKNGAIFESGNSSELANLIEEIKKPKLNQVLINENLIRDFSRQSFRDHFEKVINYLI